MKDFLFVFCIFIFFPNNSVFGVYIKNEEPSTTPPLQVEELPWLSFFNRKSSDEFGRKAEAQIQRNNLDLVSHSSLCPPGETGQFPYPPDCKRFINCWKGRGSIQVCAPGTLFNPETFECDFPGKVKCEDSFEGFGDQVPKPTRERYVRFPHQRPQIMHNQRLVRRNQNEPSKPDSIPAKPYPGRPPYFGPSHLLPPTRPANQTRGREVRPQCALGATGLYPHPYDCTKFLKCWSGNTFIQNCGPGTFFNPLISACDHPRNVPCAHEENNQPLQTVQRIDLRTAADTAEISNEDFNIPEESVQYEKYQNLNAGVKTPSKKGEKKILKLDPDSPNYDDDDVQKIGASSPKNQAEDFESPGVSDTQRKPKIINVGNSHQNSFTNAHGNEPPSYLTPPQYDLYGNLISSNTTHQTNPGIQPSQIGSSNISKKQALNPVMYPSSPYLINYPPQGPYSTLQSGNQQKPNSFDQKKNYYGYILNKKHSHQKYHPYHPHHPHHPHQPYHPHHPVHPSHPPHPHHFHTGPPTWLAPPPFQPHYFPYYAPYHPFPKTDSNEPYKIPQSAFNVPHAAHVPIYSTNIPESNLCSTSESDNANQQESNAPKCEFGTSFYGPPINQGVIKPSAFPQSPHIHLPEHTLSKHPHSIFTGTSQTQTNSNLHSKQPENFNSQFLTDFNRPEGSKNVNAQGYPTGSSPTNLPPSQNQLGSDYAPQLQINLDSTSPKYPDNTNLNPVYQSGSNVIQTGFKPQTGIYTPDTLQKPNTINQSSYSSQNPSNYPYEQENTNPNTDYPKSPNYTPQTNYQPNTVSANPPYQSSNTNSAKTGPQQIPQYQPYLFYYYPVNSNLYPYYPGAYYPNPNINVQTPSNIPNHPQSPNTQTINSNSGQVSVPDPFPIPQQAVGPQPKPSAPFFVDSNQETSQSKLTGPVEVSDPFNNENYGPVPNAFSTDNKNISPQYKPETPVYVNPKPDSEQKLHGQVALPDPFDNKNYINKDKIDNVNPFKQNENIHGTPYYPAYNPKDSSRPAYSSSVISTEYSKEVATFPPFPGESQEPYLGNVKSETTGIKSKADSPREYLLGKIDVRTGGEDDDSLKDVESQTQLPVKKKGNEKVDESVIRPSYVHPDKYSEAKIINSSNKMEENNKETDGKSPEEPSKSSKPESDFDAEPVIEPPKKQIKKPSVKVRQTPPNGQVVRLRNGASHLDGYLEMKDSKSKWGLVCDHAGQWGITEAMVACRELGFIRGAELSWQGYPIKSDLEELHVAVNGINCTGTEATLSECTVTRDGTDQCDIGRNAVGLRCFDNLASHCQPGEILYNQHCYKLHGKKNPDDPWIKTEEASEECKKYGGKLVDITSQYENDFISEWLIKKHPDVTVVATGGIGISVLGRPMWLWEGTNDPMVYERWWSGWMGDQNIPKGSINGPLCIVLRKTFSCTDDDDTQKNTEPANNEETCSADYFFWDVEDCSKMRTSVFICERPMDDIGCVVGNGEGYVGTANTTASGLPCLPWDHPKVVEGLARRGTVQERSSRLVGHNYCRNLGKPDRHPWCFVEGRRNSEYCAIPQCWDSVSGSYSRSSGGWSSCNANEFECKPGECIKKDWICDGQNDCSNGRDEETCQTFIQEFTTERNKRMKGRGNEKWPNVNENICAKLCLENKNFKCKSFSYNFKDKDCLLSDTNIGLSGQVVTSKGWVYHERSSDSLKCLVENGLFGCQNGKCVNVSNVCDGKKNCEDDSDEKDCDRLGYQIRLAGSQEKNKGRVEVKILGKWGVVCDDMFDMRDAEVVCRELGFKLGATEVFKHSEFPVENPLFLIDRLDCLGNETTIRECPFPGWGKHNCGPEEVVGVACRMSGIECPEGHWQCKKSKECISLAYLCDELKDCDDGTDEDKLMCRSPTQIRLGGGTNATAGRLEIRRFNIWGTVCHDDFGPEAGQSVCRLLGFNGPSIVKKSAYFGPGKGPIWLDSGLCFVNETNLEECTKHMGFQNNCKHDEDVSLICSQQEFNQKSAAIKPIAASSADDDNKRSEEKLRQVLISECSGKPKTKSKAPLEKYEKVVGGSNVAREALPWQASVRVKSGGNKSVHWCGAIVISPYHVLTAGHCLRDYNKAAYFIRVGDYDTKVPDPHEKDFGIETLYMHPEFGKSINLNNDIGLVKIKGEILLGEHIKPACLAPSVDIYLPGTNCSVSGWGSVSANAAGYARTLRKAFVPILDPSICRAPFVYGQSLSEGMFCAGHLDGGVDSCQGDSGGPLMCYHEGRNYLFGITSWGHGCGRANKPGVYTNVAFYADWIQQKIQSSMS